MRDALAHEESLRLPSSARPAVCPTRYLTVTLTMCKSEGMPKRLTNKEREIAELLVEHGASTGWALAEVSEGKLKRGTVYVTLSRMADKGLVTTEVQDRPSDQSGPPRRYYSLTKLAVALLRMERELDALTPEFA